MIVVLDCETTGKDRNVDQIIELCIQLGLDPELAGALTWRVKPTVPIHPEAQRVHGISAADLWDCHPFADIADQVREVLAGAVAIVGYNVRFDLEMVQAELVRAGREPLDLGPILLIDPLRLWQTVEPRTLEAAHARFCGAPILAAHQARADVAATSRVLASMVRAFGLDPTDWVALAAKADPLPERHIWLGPSNHVQWQGGEPVITFGKHKGIPVAALAEDYARWLTSKDFPPHVKEIVRASRRPDFLPWCRARWPEPSRPAELAEAV